MAAQKAAVFNTQVGQISTDQVGQFYSAVNSEDRYNETQLKRFPPVERPLVHVHPGSGRKVLFPSAHIDRVSGMSVPEGRLLVTELLEHTTQPKFVYRHTWRAGDYVMWDNRATLHRGRRYNLKLRRDLRRTTTLERLAVGRR